MKTWWDFSSFESNKPEKRSLMRVDRKNVTKLKIFLALKIYS